MRPIVVLALCTAMLGCAPGAPDSVPPGDRARTGVHAAALEADWAWSPAGTMSTPRHLHTATALQNGKVLVAGGESNGEVHISADLYDPDSGTWSPAAPLAAPRFQHTEALLEDGKVLVVGGYGYGEYLALASLYDPESDTWADTAPMTAARLGNGTTLLPDGDVLVTGGYDNGLLASTEAWNPAAGTWSGRAPMDAAKNRHTATLLEDGKVLVAGGFNGTQGIVSARVYDPASDTWSAAASLTEPRWLHTATLLADGRVLVTGGHGSPEALASAELYDPVADTWSPAASMHHARFGASAVRLASGEVLLLGGSSGATADATAEVYDPTADLWSEVAPMATPREGQTATLLPSGGVLVVGGSNSDGPLASAERFERATPCQDCASGGGSGSGGADVGGNGSGGNADPGGCAVTPDNTSCSVPWLTITVLAGLLARRRRRGRHATTLTLAATLTLAHSARAAPSPTASPTPSPTTSAAPSPTASPTPSPTTGPAPSLDDYKRFRALSIDLLGRMPTRDEVAAFERAPDLDRWVDAHLESGGHVERLARTYLDVLRLETAPSLLYQTTPTTLRRTKILGPDGKELHVYFRRGQRRLRPETDGDFCLTEKETGLKVKLTNQVVPEGTPFAVDKKVLEAATVLVRPWWLYEDARAAVPSRRYGEQWNPGGTYRPMPTFLTEPDGSPTIAVRVCREEAQTSETGTLYASGRDVAIPPETLGRQSPAPADTPYVKQHRGEPVSCRSYAGFALSADCGCGVGLEACLPGDSNSKDVMGFILPGPGRAPLGTDLPFDEGPQGYSAWHKLWWSQEASQLLAHLFSEDRDFREVLTGRWTYVNGPLAQFYRATAPSSAGAHAKGFAPMNVTQPIVDPASVPPALSPHDFDTWTRLEDRGPRAAGITTTPAFLMKYASRRARGATLYTAFLCKSFNAEKARLEPSTEPDLRLRPGCSSCHATLEPLAAYFTRIVETNFMVLSESVFPVDSPKCRVDPQGKIPTFCPLYYDPVFSDSGRAMLRGAYASPAHADVGPPGAARDITSSPEFASCAVQRVAEAFLGRPLSSEDDALTRSLGEVFVQGGYRMKALVRALLRSEAYAHGNGWSSTYLRAAAPSPAPGAAP